MWTKRRFGRARRPRRAVANRIKLFVCSDLTLSWRDGKPAGRLDSPSAPAELPAMLTTALRRPLLGLLLASAVPAAAQAPVTTPEGFFGHPIGADYLLPDYERTV